MHNNYELVLNMLTDLSYIEFELLIMLYKYEKPYHDAGVKVKSVEFWDDEFMPEAKVKFLLDSSVILGYFRHYMQKACFI